MNVLIAVLAGAVATFSMTDGKEVATPIPLQACMALLHAFSIDRLKFSGNKVADISCDSGEPDSEPLNTVRLPSFSDVVVPDFAMIDAMIDAGIGIPAGAYTIHPREDEFFAVVKCYQRYDPLPGECGYSGNDLMPESPPVSSN